MTIICNYNIMSVKFFGTITALHGYNDDFRYNNIQDTESKIGIFVE